MNNAVLAEGAFRTHLGGLRVDTAMTRNLLLSAFVRHNSEGQIAQTQRRLRYIFRGIDNFYLVYTDARQRGGPSAQRSRALTAKVTFSLSPR